MKKNILLFSDFGIDDMVAAAFALFSDELNIVGIVADYGNVSKEDALKNAAFLKRLTNMHHIPVFGGAELPLTGEIPTYFPEIHGKAGLGPIVTNEEIDIDFFENLDEIKMLIEKYSDNIYIVNIGRLSSLATTFILYPTLMEKVKGIYVMGGAFYVPGNITSVAEANIYGDPYAANIVFMNAPFQIHIIPLDVTMSALLTSALMNHLHGIYVKYNHQFGMTLKPMVDHYFKFYQSQHKSIGGSPLHDVLTLWAMLDESEISYMEAPVKVIVDRGHAFGQVIGDFRNFTDDKKEPHRIHKIAMDFDYRSFIRSFYYIMTNIR